MVLDGVLTVLGGESRIGRSIVLYMEGQLALSISFQTEVCVSAGVYVCMHMHVNVYIYIYHTAIRNRG